MSTKKPTNRRFIDGQTVKSRLSPDPESKIVISGATWNGFTWMYSFLNTNMRCGEEYLTTL